MVTLAPVLQELGFHSPTQQRAFVKLLQAAGGYGILPGVEGVLSDAQADAVLAHVEFASPQQAAQWLHEVTREKMLRTPDTERFQCADRPELEAARDTLLPVLRELGLIAGRQPSRKYYDHVLVMGAMEAAVDNRLNVLRELHDRGVGFGHVHLLGSERPLLPEREQLAEQIADKTEMGMMQELYLRKSREWPKALRDLPVTAVDTQMKADGTRPNTRDTATAWLDSGARPGRVLVISNQPYLDYQDAAVKSALPEGYEVETVGSPVRTDCVRMSVACDALARRIDAGLERLMVQLALRQGELAASDIVRLKPEQIHSDPETYQFRSDIDGNGLTHRYRQQVAHWDDILNGDPLLVHQRKDGTYYVADGHHRLDLAQRANAQGKGPQTLAARVLREADGYSAKDAKLIAAYKNLAHGHCDLMDAAKVMKQARDPDVHQHLLPQLPMECGNLRDVEALSKLPQEAFAMIERGEVPAQAGAEVAKLVDDPARQLAVMDIVRSKLAAPEMPEQSPGFAARITQQRQQVATNQLAI